MNDMVDDKIHSRGRGPVQILTRQPMEGRSRDGGLRFGEMERDSILAHGLAGFLNESMMERSDGHTVSIDDSDGLISETEHAAHQTRVQMPYSCKLLMQELQTMSIGMRVVTEHNQPQNPEVFNYLMETS